MRKRISAIAIMLVFSQWAVLLLLHGQNPSQQNPERTSEQKILKALLLPLNSVRLLGGRLKTAQDLDAKYLLELEPDRMLAYLPQRAGLEPYGGWDGAGGNSRVTSRGTISRLSA